MSLQYLKEATDPLARRNAGDAKQLTFSISGEDHTIGNAIKSMLSTRLDVEFVGYSIPHPSQSEMNLRLQVTGEQSALDVFEEGIDQIAQLLGHIDNTFEKSLKDFQKTNSAMSD